MNHVMIGVFQRPQASVDSPAPTMKLCATIPSTQPDLNLFEMSDAPSMVHLEVQPISNSPASTSDSLCLEAVWFQKGQKRATVQILHSCTLAQLRAEIQQQFPELDSDMYRFVYDGKVVTHANSALLSECSFRNNTKLLVLPDTFLKWEFDPSFCGDYISLSPNHRSVQLDSANERWYSARGRLVDSASSSLTHGIHHWHVSVFCFFTTFRSSHSRSCDHLQGGRH
jgi:hypothetical protein